MRPPPPPSSPRLLPSRLRVVVVSAIVAVFAVAPSPALSVASIADATTSTIVLPPPPPPPPPSRRARHHRRLLLPTPRDLRVRHLVEIVPAYSEFRGIMYSGSLPMDHASTTFRGSNPDGSRTGNLHFWLFVPDSPAVPNTMASWFNGGPGCSSFFGALFENSPIAVPPHPAGWCCEGVDEPLTYNEYGWTAATVMLYVEQPAGVGFSEATFGTPPPSHEDDVAGDFDAFLQNFYRVFDGYETTESEYDPKLDMTTHRLTLVGESYAGTYIPSVARGIHRNNVANAPNIDGSERVRVPLSGIAIGNGKIDAITQSRSIPDWAYWHGLIDAGTRDYYAAEFDRCVRNLLGSPGASHYGPGVEPAPFHSFTLRSDCGIFDSMIEAAGSGALGGTTLDSGPNIYDYSTWDAYEAGDGAGGTVSKFFNHPGVQEALNVPHHRRGGGGDAGGGHVWEGCIPEVDADWVGDGPDAVGSPNFMDGDGPWDVTPYIADLLDEARIDVLIYSGDRDMICNTQGSDAALSNMEWSGTKDPALSSAGVVATKTRNAWTEADRGLWLYDGYPAGYTKSYKNLNLLTVYNAGHMVPYNQPGPALDMMIRFLRGESFHDRPLVSYSSWHLPEEEDPTNAPPSTAIPPTREGSMVGELLLRQSIVSTTKTTLPSAGGTSNSGTVPPGTTMSAVSVLAAMALLVATAFSLGMWVGGRAVAPGGGGTTGRREMRPLKEEDCNYGSI